MPRRKQKNWSFGTPSKSVTRSKAELAQIAAEQREAERGYLSSGGGKARRRPAARKAHATRMPAGAKKGLPRKTESFWRGAGVEFDPSLFRENGMRRKKGNPADTAAAKYEEFHGRPSEETVVVKREIHYHKHLASLGKLKKLVVVSREGYNVPIDRFKGAILCENEKGTQLYVEGGDQAVDLSQFGIDPDEAHEMEVLGDVIQVLYFTRKDHLGKEGGIANYDHKFEEPYPELQYDVRNEQLIFSGGRYVILPEGIDR
jgi:hypothetical protein